MVQLIIQTSDFKLQYYEIDPKFYTIIFIYNTEYINFLINMKFALSKYYREFAFSNNY